MPTLPWTSCAWVEYGNCPVVDQLQLTSGWVTTSKYMLLPPHETLPTPSGPFFLIADRSGVTIGTRSCRMSSYRFLRSPESWESVMYMMFWLTAPSSYPTLPSVGWLDRTSYGDQPVAASGRLMMRLMVSWTFLGFGSAGAGAFAPRAPVGRVAAPTCDAASWALRWASAVCCRCRSRSAVAVVRCAACARAHSRYGPAM